MTEDGKGYEGSMYTDSLTPPIEPKIAHLTPQAPLEPLRGMDG